MTPFHPMFSKMMLGIILVTAAINIVTVGSAWRWQLAMVVVYVVLTGITNAAAKGVQGYASR